MELLLQQWQEYLKFFWPEEPEKSAFQAKVGNPEEKTADKGDPLILCIAHKSLSYRSAGETQTNIPKS